MLVDRFTFTDKPADEYLPWHGHVGDDTVLLADGSHLATIRLDGRPMSLMDDPARYAERRRRHAMLRALADTNLSLYEHHVCHDRIEPFRHGRFRSAYARQLAEDYHAGLDSGLRVREWFLTIIVRPPPFSGVIHVS
jgi:type IV secretion system protein VirB4